MKKDGGEADIIAGALVRVFESPEVVDRSGMTSANVVDALDYIGRALWAVATAIESIHPKDKK